MGACLSINDRPKRGSVRKSATGVSSLQRKVSVALQAKLAEQAKEEHPMTLERILLKFDRMSDVLGYVKDTFLQFSQNGHSVNLEGLTQALTSIKGSAVKEEDLAEIYSFADLTENKEINLKEFVVSLVVCLVLGTISFGQEAKVKLAPSPRRQSLSVSSTNTDIFRMLTLILSAYLLFDVNGDGCIYHENVEKLLEESGHKVGEGGGGNNTMMSSERWKELDWDANGTIDLAEFVNAFTMWVDIDEVLTSTDIDPSTVQNSE